MELRKWRVYLDGVLLDVIPKGLDKFTREFVRDNELFGIYSVSSFDLTFSGDGYCELKDFQDNVEACEKTLRIDRYCRNGWTTIFNGIIEVGSVEIDEENGIATCEIQDNSPISLISRNADLLVDVETTKGIYGNTITPATFGSTNLDGLGGINYNTYNVIWSDVFRVVLEAITGVGVNVSSNFLDTAPTEEKWSLIFTGTLADITDITLTFINFQGETKVITTSSFTGNNAIGELGIRSLNEFANGSTIADQENGIRNDNDFRYFLRADVDNPTPTELYLYSSLPMEIISVIANGSTPIDVSFSKTQTLIDGGNNPVFLNYKSLKGGLAPYLLEFSFKELMEEFNKIYSVFFVATFNSSGDIDFELFSEDEINNAPIDYTFSNAENLKSKFDENSIFNKLSTKDGSGETLLDTERVFASEFCGLGDSLDLENKLILGSVPTQTELPLVFDDSLLKNKYIIDNNGVATLIAFRYGVGTTTTPTNIINIWITNWHKIYRHLNKFRNNIIGVANYYNPSTNNFSINITNTALNRLFRKYEFSEQMSNDEFNGLSDSIIDKAQFKRANQTAYRDGLIMSVQYDYETGKADLTILGQ